MNTSRSDRAVSELLGALLIFGLLVLLLVLAQVSLVPALNYQAEADHSIQSRASATELTSDLSQVALSGGPLSMDYPVGFEHPERPLLLNPDAAKGYIEATEPTPVTLYNVNASGEANDYWNGSERSFDSQGIRVRTDYREYGGGGVTYVENSVLFTEYDGGDPVVYAGQSKLVQGRQISLISVVGGDYSESSDSVTTVSLTPVSGPAQTITVTDDGQPIEIVFSSRLPVSTWQELLADQLSVDDADDKHVLSVVPGPNGTVKVTLEPDVTYTLRMARVSVGDDFDPEPAAYVTRDPGAVSVVAVGGGELTVRVKDQFNNAVPGERVNFSIRSGTGTLSTNSGITEESGRASTVLSGPSGIVTIRAEIDVDGNESNLQPREYVDFQVQIGSGGGGGDGDTNGEINPNEVNTVALQSAYSVDCADYTNDAISITEATCTVEMTFKNLDPNNATTIEQARVSYYGPSQAFKIANSPAKAGRPGPYVATIDGADLNVTGPYKTVTLTELKPEGDLDGDDVQTFMMTFTIALNQQNNNQYDYCSNPATSGCADYRYNVAPGDFFVFRVIFEDGHRSTYFVTPVPKP